jgi:hypothetical protein
VTYDRYTAKVTVWYRADALNVFSDNLACDWKQGTYSLHRPVVGDYLKQRDVVLENMFPVADLINELKAPMRLV